MGDLKDRKQPLAVRAFTDAIKDTNKNCYNYIRQLNMSKNLLSCPICINTANVKYTGTNKGIRKFVCSAHEKSCHFSTTTSFEAIEVYRNDLAKNLCLLALTNSKIDGIVNYNETSKYFVEFALEGLYQYIKNDLSSETVHLKGSENAIAIFLDISGSGLSRNKAIILARIDDNLIFEVVTVSNYLSTHQLLAAIKEKYTFEQKDDLVFITDGEQCFVDSIREFFPNAIHIRQFHKDSCRGIIYVHFKYKGEYYTLRCLWDAVLNDDSPSKSIELQREYKAKRKLEQKEKKKKIEYSELSNEVILWKGTVYMPRGIRRRLKSCNTETMPKCQCKKEKTCKKENEIDTCNDKQTKYKTEDNTKDTSRYDSHEVVFKGTIEEAKTHGILKNYFRLLKTIFGGLYISSNAVETIFNFKSKLYPHRTIKNGERLLVCVIYNCIVLKNKSKEWLMKFFKSKVITYDFILKYVLYGSGVQKNKKESKKSSFIDIINAAIENTQRLVIYYLDKQKKRTTRIISPIKLKVNDYNKTHILESYCHKRNANRSFCVERIQKLALYDPKPIIL